MCIPAKKEQLLVQFEPVRSVGGLALEPLCQRQRSIRFVRVAGEDVEKVVEFSKGHGNNLIKVRRNKELGPELEG